MGNTRKWPVPRRGSLKECQHLFEYFHPYGKLLRAGEVWVCEQEGEVVAAWTWQPPPHGSARKVAPECPGSVLSLSRMVAIPKSGRGWHISKPLKWIMKNGLDRGRWPVLVTYADTGEGHTGHVYRCSGWNFDGVSESKKYTDNDGNRRSVYSNGKVDSSGLVLAGKSTLLRFIHRVCPSGNETEHLLANGWSYVDVGGFWRSGNPKKRWVKSDD